MKINCFCLAQTVKFNPQHDLNTNNCINVNHVAIVLAGNQNSFIYRSGIFLLQLHVAIKKIIATSCHSSTAK